MAILGWIKRVILRRFDDDEFQDEIRAHLTIAAEERMADGADPTSARQAALKDFGNVTLTREAAHGIWTPRWVEALHDVINDVRYAIRALTRNAAFSLTVIGVLTLGIGLNAAVFTMLKSMELSPLAGVQEASRLAVIYGETGTGRTVRVSYPDYQYIRDHDQAFAALMASGVTQVNLGRGRSARPVSGELVTGNYFQVLGVRAALGRTLLPSDELAPGRHPVVVISGTLWRHEFNADPNIVGKPIQLNNYALTVVGVAEPAFHGTIVSYDVEVFIPIMMTGEMGLTAGQGTTSSEVLTNRRARILFPHGYLRPGVTIANAGAQTAAIWDALSRNQPATEAAQQMRVVPFWRSPTGGQTYLLPTMVVLSVMGLLVLLIACTNISGLVMVRAVARRGEVALRLALGATRMRIVRLLIVENLVLAIPGALLGLVLAWRGIPVLVRYAEWLAAPQRLFFNIEVDRLVIGYSAALTCGCALAFGFMPALRSSRMDLLSVIREDFSPRSGTRGRMRTGLVVAQVAVSLLLLVGAGMATHSVDAARRVYPGFDSSHVSAIDVDVAQNAYDEVHGRVFYRQLLDTARAASGVESATLAANPPLGFLDTPARRVTIEGYEPTRGEDLSFLSNTIAPEYFQTLRISVTGGRAFEDRDDETAAPVVMVNDTFAQRFWGGAANAPGKRIRFADGAWRTVVGVAADVKYSRIDETPRPYVYLPFLQAYRSNMILHTRGSAPVGDLVDQARAQVLALDADLPILAARPLAERTRGAFVFYELTAMMLFIFGGAGMALAALGTYGLVSYVVKQRTHEIGIRMALGASRLSVLRELLRRGLKLGVIGAAIGGLAALGLGGLLSGVLFGVSATDGVAFTRALAIVLSGVLMATMFPAWRASRTDPLRALRHH